MSGRYLARKGAQAILTIIAIVVLNFILFRMMPGLARARPAAQPVPDPGEDRRRSGREWGLDKPLFPDQLVGFTTSTLQGDLGYSFFFRGKPVTEVIGERFWPTILLIGLGELISIIVGLWIGAQAGWKRGGLDRLGSAAVRHSSSTRCRTS